MIKTILKFTIAFAFLLINKLIAQSPNVCTNAQIKSFPLNTFTITSYSDSVYWYKISLNQGQFRFKYTNNSTTGRITKCEAYVGTCGALTLINRDELTYGDSLLENNFKITSSATVYFRLVNYGVNSMFSVSAPTDLFITGQTSYCPGQTITIFPSITNSATGTPTISWLPGGASTYSLTLSPTTPITYTCIFKDAAGTYTNQINIFQLPSAVCSSCEYVENGHLEWYGSVNSLNSYNPILVNIESAYSWFRPMAQFSLCSSSSVYFNGDRNGTSMVGSGVPTNYLESNLPAHSGKGYANFRAGATNNPSWFYQYPEYREYLENKLKYPLVAGQTYSVSFWGAVSSYSGYPAAINHIGAHLSVTSLTQPATYNAWSMQYPKLFPITYTPQIESSGVFVSCGTFAPISGTVTGNGENYVTIGNFYNDASTTQTLSNCPGTNTSIGPYLAQYYIDDLSITPVPPILSCSTPTILNCSQSTITLTASGAASAYTSWTDGSNIWYGSTVVIPTPLFTTTYSCTVNLPYVGGCGLGGVVTVVNTCNLCTATNTISTSSLTNTTLASTSYALNNNISIIGSVTFSNCEISIANSRSITVTPGSTLNIIGSHLYSCSSMWQGIIVQPGASINIINSAAKSSLIEDAIVAVYIQGGSTLTSNILNANYATFNKNKTSIYISGYNLAISPYPFTVWGCLFTSRNISFTPGALNWPHNNIIKSASNPTTTPLETPYINNTTYPPTSLKAPYSGSKPDFGIKFDNVGLTLNAGTTPTYYEAIIGIGSGISNRYNLFDNLITCISGIDVNLYCINNIFQNTQTYGRGGNMGGIGIDISSFQTNTYRLKVTGASPSTYINYFYNCSKAIKTNYVFEHIVSDCNIRSTNVAYSIPILPLNPAGDIGFDFKTHQYRNVTINNNHLFNIANCILFSADAGSFSVGGGVANGRYGGQVSITNNEIANNLTGQPVSTQFVNIGVSLNDVLISTSGYSIHTIPGTSLTVSNNTMTGVWNGVYVNNFGQQPISILNNTVTLVNQPSLTSPPTQAGISSTQVNDVFIYKNNISGPTTYSTNMKGITTSMNSTLTVKCNTTSQTTRGIEFNSTQANTIAWDNTMANTHLYGFVLDNAGVIGTQGSTSVPSDNQWPGTWGTTSAPYKTATKGISSSISSPLYIRFATGNYDPDNSAWTDLTPNVDDYFYPGTGSTLINITGSPSARTCPTTPLCRTCRGSIQEEAIASNETLLEQLAQGKILYKETSAELEYMNQLYVYRQLASKPKTRNQAIHNSGLNQFYNSTARTNIAALDNIEVDLLGGDYKSAKNKIVALTPNNAIENNYKNYYTAYVNSKEGAFSSTDSSNIVLLANGCPFTDGGVVYQARALFNVVFDTYRLFYDVCNNDSLSQRFINNIEQTAIGVLKFSKVYPNPTADLLNVSVINTKDNEEVGAEIFDVTGKLVYSSKQTLNNGSMTLNFDLNNGTYIIKIKLSDGTIDVHRLVINR